MAEASTRWTTEQSGCTQPKGSQDEGASTGRPSTVSARPFKCWFTRATNYQERTTASCTCYGSASASSYPTSSCLRSCPRETTTRRKHLRMRQRSGMSPEGGTWASRLVSDSYRSKDGGPLAITTRRRAGSTWNTAEYSMWTGNGPLSVHGPQASQVKSPSSRTSYLEPRFSITPVLGAVFVISRAFRLTRRSSQGGVVAGALIVTVRRLGCVALSLPPTRLTTSARVAAPPHATSVQRRETHHGPVFGNVTRRTGWALLAMVLPGDRAEGPALSGQVGGAGVRP